MARINEFLHREYDVEAQVDDVMVFINRWTTWSEEARQSLTGHLDLSYGDTDRQSLDIFPAAGNSNKWLIYIHGGYWRLTTKDDYSFIASPFVNAGINVAIFDHDPRPHATIAEITEQCRRELAWLYKNAEQYSGPCENLIITGHSAGGHLTAMMYATNWGNYGVPGEIIKGGIGLSGLYDLTPLLQSRMNDEFLGLTEESAKATSPIRYSPTVDAPLVLSAGELESDEFKRQNHLLHGEPTWQDITSELILAEGCHHFNIFDKFTDMDHAMWDFNPFA